MKPVKQVKPAKQGKPEITDVAANLRVRHPCTANWGNR